jgi:hypothetical protein
MRRMLTAGGEGQPGPRKRFQFPALLGGFGLLGCVACCTLPLLGAIGIGSGAAAVLRFVEPLSAVLLALGGVAAVVAFVRFHNKKKSCAAPSAAAADPSCATDGSCGCGPGPRLPGPAQR